MLALLRILNMLLFRPLQQIRIVHPIALVALLKNMVIHQNSPLLEHKQYLGLQPVIEHGDK